MSDKNLFNMFSSLDNLKKAWIKAKHYASTEYIFFDEFAFTEFSEHIDAKIVSLAFELQQGTYGPEPVRFIGIPKGEKQRKVYFASPKDTVVMQALMNVIGPIFEDKFSPVSFGNRLNIGVEESKETYKRWQDQYSHYVSTVRDFWNYGSEAWYLITDIENFYPTISRDWLFGIIGSVINDKKVIDLIFKFLNVQAYSLTGILEDVFGIAPGLIHSHFFANIYLNEFDHLATTKSIKYARYVDDICVLCKDKESLEDLNRILSNYLGQFKQGFKLEKTVQKPNDDIEPLDEHTRKMKYANRLDFFETLDVDDQTLNSIKSAERPFSKLYRIAEKEGDISTLVEEAGIVINYLRLIDSNNLREIIISLIDLHPLKPSILRTAICALLENESADQSDQMWELINKKILSDEYFTLIFLKIISYYNLDFHNLLEYLQACCKSPNVLIRAASYYELWKLMSSKKQEIELSFFNDLFLKEKDPYARSRLIFCYSGIRNSNISLTIFHLIGLSNLEHLLTNLRSIHYLIMEKQLEPNNFLQVWAKIQHIPKFDAYQFIEIFYLASRYQLFWIVEALISKSPYQNKYEEDRVLATISMEVIESFSKESNFASLYQFSDFLNDSGFKVEASIGFEEIKSGINDDLLKEQISNKQTISRVTEPVIDLPGWTKDSLCNKFNYRYQQGDNRYLCRYFSDNHGHSGILEIISNDHITNNGFSSELEWMEYLTSLEKCGVTPLVKKYFNPDVSSQSYYFYEIPEGYKSINDLLKHSNVGGLLSQNIIFKIAASLTKAIQSNRHSNFAISSIDPLSIFWHPTNEKLLIVNIGASLGISKYECGNPGCINSDEDSEIGISAAPYHLGLLLLQMLKKECPIGVINSVKNRYSRKKTVYDTYSDVDLLPHHKLILARLLQFDPSLRYINFQWLDVDLSNANILLECITEYRANKSNVNLNALILMDFITFRLRVIARNPSLLDEPPIKRSQKTIEELSESLKYLPKDILMCWPTKTKKKSRKNYLEGGILPRDISPEGYRLLDISNSWEKLCEENNENKLPTPILTTLILYQVLSIEVQATIYAGIRYSCPEDINTLVKAANKVIDKLFALYKSNDVIEIEFRSNYFQNNKINIEVTRDQLGSLSRFLRDLKNHEKDGHLPKLDSLNTFSLLYLLLGISAEIVHKNKVIYKSTQVLKFRKKVAKSKSFWSFLFEFPQLDKKIKDLQIINNENYLSNQAEKDATDILEHFPSFIRVIRSLNSASRVSAEIYSYQDRNFYFEKDGLAEIVSIIPKQIAFDSAKVFISGRPAIGELRKRRSIRLDIVKVKRNSLVPVSVLAPLGRFSELPTSTNRFTFYKLSVWLRRLPVVAGTLVLVITTAMIFVLLSAFNMLFSTILAPLTQAMVSFVIGIVSTIFTKSYESFFATLRPEESDD